MATNTLADQLRALIEASPLTDGKLGKAAEVPAATIWRFRKKERDITLETAGLLAEVLGAELVVTRRKAKAARRAASAPRDPTEDGDAPDPEP
jgi:transcriptional regulator with XRE-family HTH domain